MKAILIDDEKHTRVLLRKIIEWQALGVSTLLEAADGETAATIIESEQPEIIVTDMRMPVRDGVSLLQWLEKQHYPKKIIVISGFTEYHYMQKTIEYGGLDYLTKPVDEEKLASVLQKAVKLLQKEYEERRKTLETEIRVKEIAPIYLSHVMTELIENPDFSRKSLSKMRQVAEFGQTRNIAGCTSAMITFVPECGSILERFDGDADLVYFSILNIAGEILSLPERGMAFRYLARPGRLVLFVNSSAHDLIQWRRVHEKILRYLKFETEIYVGPRIQGIDTVREAYLALDDLYQNRNFLSLGLHPVHTAGDKEGTASIPLMDREDHLMMALRTCDKAEIIRRADLILQMCENAGFLPRKQISSWEAELDRARERLEIPSGAGTELHWWDRCGRFSLENLRDSLIRELLETAKRHEVSRSRGQRVAAEVHDYINEHYARPISVKSLAHLFHLNAEHLSRLFQQRYQISIKDHLMSTRMAKARKLLESGTLKVNEVAMLVGFEDEKYFSKIFRKHVGMAPNDYKKSRGQ